MYLLTCYNMRIPDFANVCTPHFGEKVKLCTKCDILFKQLGKITLVNTKAIYVSLVILSCDVRSAA
uniref:Uncharacterized protein n=1 Tax=Arundo donax TaxID=35708 RepID=A0A0A9HQW4_ARUDO